MARLRNTRKRSGELWRDGRSSQLPKPQRSQVKRERSSGSRCRVERDEALESRLEAMTTEQGIAEWRSLGVYFRLSGACIESIGVTGDVPFPGSCSRWIEKFGSEIRKIVNA